MTTRRTFWLVGVLLVTAGGLAGLSFVLLQRSAPPPPQPTAAAPAADAGIGCLGRIEPEDGLVRVAARSISGQPSIVGELKVREGETVSPGQLLALLDSRAQLAAALRSAESRVALARTRLAQVKAGPKAADVAAQNAEIARLASELATAEKELHRYEALVERGISPSAGLDARRQRVASNRQALAHARARLESLSEVRREDVDVGEAELEAAQTEVVRARTDLAETSIHAPVAGQVVRVYAWPGEEVGPRGLLEIGKTARMYAIAEVPESDIPRLRVGQRATVAGEALPGKVQGAVESIGMKIARNELQHMDPSLFSDTRVVEVKVRLDGTPALASLIHAKVSVVIHP